MSNFTKSDLIQSVAQTTGKARKDVEEIVAATLAVIKEETNSGKTVNLTGFGRFTVKERAARNGRNPQTGESMQIAASRSLGFKASKTAA